MRKGLVFIYTPLNRQPSVCFQILESLAASEGFSCMELQN